MFRSALVRSLRSVAAPRVVRRSPLSLQAPRSTPIFRSSQFAPCLNSQAIRSYSAPAGLNKTEVEGRIVDLLKNFDKVRKNFVLLVDNN